jgi:hypothetical protein
LPIVRGVFRKSGAIPVQIADFGAGLKMQYAAAPTGV